MTTRILTLTSEPHDCYRVACVAGILDAPVQRQVVRTIQFEEPPKPEEPWKIGAILGPSGAGKTAVANALYRDAFRPDGNRPWKKGGALIEQFDEIPVEKIFEALNAVGLCAPTLWLQEIETLSTGERFRAELARALLLSTHELVVFDEFANYVDRVAAQNIARSLRKAFDHNLFPQRKLLVVSCRYDFCEALQPDWTLDLATGALQRGRLRPQPLTVYVRRADRAVWRYFKRFHYLSGDLNRASQVYVATAMEPRDFGPPRETMLACAAILQVEGQRGQRRVHRLVVQPNYQGLGVGGAFLDELARLQARQGYRLNIVTGHRAFVKRLERSKLWRLRAFYPHGRLQRHKGKPSRGSFGRAVASFYYIGEPRCTSEPMRTAGRHATTDKERNV
ncbi:MAG: ABC transporter ATP-binding protein [Planctomycetia bacterium]|nr:ABC transporter ATP-binding protein [Planctomycetia bacterium]